MKRISIALAVMASVKSWSIATLPPSLYAGFSYPVSGGKTGIAAARRAAKKRRKHAMADIIDNASEIEELQRNAALSAHRIDRNAVSAEHCEECGEKIPAPRRAAVPGCQTCTSCQADLELMRKQRGM